MASPSSAQENSVAVCVACSLSLILPLAQLLPHLTLQNFKADPSLETSLMEIAWFAAMPCERTPWSVLQSVVLFHYLNCDYVMCPPGVLSLAAFLKYLFTTS